MDDAVDRMLPDRPVEAVRVGELAEHDRTAELVLGRCDAVHADDGAARGREPAGERVADHAIDAGDQDRAFGH